MLLTSVTVYVPSIEEMDADQSEYGTLSLSTRSAFGEAACEAGDPDNEGSDIRTTAVDTIANILHYLADAGGIDPLAALRTAEIHFTAEQRGDTL